MNNQIRRSICPYDCPASCGLLAETDGTRVLRVQGDPENPATRGLICNKMQHYEESVHAPGRILTPMRRVGRKGEGRFEPVSWDAAVEEIAGRWKGILEEDGGAALLPVYFSGVMSIIQRKCVEALFNRMNGSQLVKTLCSSAKSAAYESVVGKTGCLDPRELEDSDLLLVWGSNVKATRIHTMPVIRRLREAGKRVILIEACGVSMAPYCDETFLIRPGTDGALALAMMHVLEQEHLTDQEFLQNRTVGYEAFRETLGRYTPQWAEEITGIPSGRIRTLAREFGAAKAPAILLGSGPTRYGNGGMTTRLILILSAYTGAWGKAGGGYCGSNPVGKPFIDENRVTRPDFRIQEGRSININLLGQALECQEPGKTIRGIYVAGGNPVNSVADQTAILRGLAREDLFTVVHERFLTDTAKYADMILPATFSVEQSDVSSAYGYCTFGHMRKVLDAPGECRSNWNTVCTLARAMGYEDGFFRQTEEELVEDLLAHPQEGLAGLTGEDWKRLREGGVISVPYANHGDFRTPDGKFRIVDECLPVPIPCYQEPYGGAEPLRLVMVPDFHTLNSIFLERKDLVERRGKLRLMMHPQDAAARGIQDGDPVTARNDLAEVELAAELTELVAPGTVAVSGVYNGELTGRQLQINALHHGRLSDMGAATTMNDNAVEVCLTNVGKYLNNRRKK